MKGKGEQCSDCILLIFPHVGHASWDMCLKSWGDLGIYAPKMFVLLAWFAFFFFFFSTPKDEREHRTRHVRVHVP
jgi:hypothetical protein